MNQRLVWGALLIVLLVGGGGYVVFGRLFAKPPPPVVVVAPPVKQIEPVPVPVEPERQNAIVLSVEGDVDKVSPGGESVRVQAGDRLFADDSLRTNESSKAELSIGDASRLTVTESTELKVRELTRAVHQVQLKRGRLVARYDVDGERVLRIEDERGLAVAETKSARFSILSSGQALAVATETGSVNLNAAGKAVEIGAGQQAVARDGEAPSAATTISAQVLLKIARAGRSDASLCAVVEGTVDTGAELNVDGTPVTIDAKGHFRAAVPRRAGQRQARVSVRDASGRTREQVVACRAEAAAPPLKVKLNWGAPDAG